MNIYFDTEFTGLHQNTTLISIGLVSANGNQFYGVFNDYDKDQVNIWIKNNVLNNLVADTANIVGTKNGVKEVLLKWLNQFSEIEWVSDVCHYDFVLLIDLLFGDAENIPANIGKSCHDINQDIAKAYYISESAAFDKSREEILKSHNISIPGNKHNSLYDAAIIKQIYDILAK